MNKSGLDKSLSEDMNWFLIFCSMLEEVIITNRKPELNESHKLHIKFDDL